VGNAGEIFQFGYRQIAQERRSLLIVCLVLASVSAELFDGSGGAG
jgi:hypothetical protein